MKKVISEENLYSKMQEAINLLCNTVKSTLGPKGNNVIIDHSTLSPFITNDGVTIANNIESDDEAVNTILELAKEASIKTNDLVGDGTTTTLVLLESLFNEGLKLIKEGMNPIVLKKELDSSLNNVIKLIKKESTTPSSKDLEKIASISANNEDIGKTISKVFNKVGSIDAITISESANEDTTIEYAKGYSFDTNIVANYYFKDTNLIEINNCYLLLINNVLEDIDNIASIINYINENNKSLVIIANDYNDLFINEILNLYLNNNIKVYLFKNSEYGIRQISLLKDLEAISNANILNNSNYISINNLGIIKNIKFDVEKTTIEYDNNIGITNRIKKIKDELLNTSLDNDFINKRIAMFNNGLATIYVGATTDTERKELKMRYDDALYAINSAKDGVIPGGGLIYLKISNLLDTKNTGDKIFKIALSKPFLQILENAGIESENILVKIQNEKYTLIFNTITENYENINNTSVLDSTNVVINALKNACSIASMLLTTKHLIINEQQNINMKNDYNEL